MKITVKVNIGNMDAHMYYHELIVMKQELIQKGASEPFKIRTNLEIRRDAEIGVHLHTEYTPWTEKQYIEKQEWILCWDVDRELEPDILILETVSKEDFLKWCTQQIELKSNEIKSLLKEIEELANFRQIKYKVFSPYYIANKEF